MKAEIAAEYRTKLREFMQEKGRAVAFDQRELERWPEHPDMWVSPYAWMDFGAGYHILGTQYGGKKPEGPCSWIVPEGAVLTEQTYSQFAGTDAGNAQEVGINVAGCRCACGEYTDMTLRFTGSLTEVLHSLLGIPTQTELVL
jgi:hypothetical protein